MDDPIVALALLVVAIAAVLSVPWWSHRLILSSKPPSVTVFAGESTSWSIEFLEKKRFTLARTPTSGKLKFELPAGGIRVSGLPEGALTAGDEEQTRAATVTVATDGELEVQVTGESVGGPYKCTVQAIGGTGHPVTDEQALTVVVIEGVPQAGAGEGDAA